MKINPDDIVVQFNIPPTYLLKLIQLQLADAKAVQWHGLCKKIVPTVKIIIQADPNEPEINLEVANATVGQITEFNKMLKKIVSEKTVLQTFKD